MEKNDFIEKIDSFAKKHRILSLNESYLVAVSGGADSVVLLRVLLELGMQCTVAHCNFHLRGAESDRDENFVTALCQNLGVECIVTHFDVAAYERMHGVSTEMACRELRYEWFRSLMAERRLNAILVAHHSDDNIETLFLNILRGSGIAGMTAMRPVNGDVRRPLLCVSRSEIERFASLINQDFIIDSSNLESVVKRNRLRNILLPMMRELFPNADSGILRTIENMQQCYGLYHRYISNLEAECASPEGTENPCSESLKINLTQLARISEESFPTAIFELIRQYGFNSANATEIASSFNSQDCSTGKKFYSSSHTAVINRGFLCIFPSLATDNSEEYIVDLSGNIESPVKINVAMENADSFTPKGLDGKRTVCFDAKIMQHRLSLRHWHKGDRFKPFGLRGSRLVSDVFSDLKLSEQEKRNVWLLTADDEIVWLLGIRSAASFPITKSTESLLRLSLAE